MTNVKKTIEAILFTAMVGCASIPVQLGCASMVHAEPEFPWLFPSPCGLESVTCDSGSLETDLEAALAASIICNQQQKQTCEVTEHEHVHSEPVCVAEGEKVVEAALAANAYLRTLSAEQRELEGRLADYLSYAFGGSAENYPLSNDLLRDMGYIK